MLVRASLRLSLAILLGIVTIPTQAGESGKRVALIIGNSAYKHTTPLANPVNDAEDIAAALEKLGFQVTKGTDLDKPGMDRAVSAFAAALKGAKVGLFFYAGHGLQVAGQNYLVPIDAKLESPSALDFEAVRLDLVQRTMERETETNVLFLDACRDNPLSRNLARSMGTRSSDIGRGLAAQESGSGTLVSFSTQPGNVALDGSGRNSPFAAALVKHIPTPGKELPAILVSVRNDVMQATAKRQVPWEHSALTGEVVLAPASAEQKQEERATDEPVAAAATAANETVSKIRVLDKQLVTLMNGTLRLKVTASYSHGLCSFVFDPGPTGRFTESESLNTYEWITKKLAKGTYRIMLAEADGQACTFEFTPE